MRILSWDVGIYNLCYCILERTIDENNIKTIKIVDWDIVNLVDNEEMKKNRSLLFENIPRKLQERPQLLDVDLVVIENQPSLKNPQMKSIQMILYSYFLILGKIVGNGDKSTGYIDKIEFCSASNKLKIYDGPPIVLEDKPKKTKAISKKKTGILIESSDENQNQNQNLNQDINENIELDLILDEDICKMEDIEDPNLKSKKKKATLAYKDKKRLAIEHAKYFVLKNDAGYIDFFNKHKKKDDLADSYLQGLYWFKNIM